jgi:hypothetical protein
MRRSWLNSSEDLVYIINRPKRGERRVLRSTYTYITDRYRKVGKEPLQHILEAQHIDSTSVETTEVFQKKCYFEHTGTIQLYAPHNSTETDYPHILHNSLLLPPRNPSLSVPKREH